MSISLEEGVILFCFARLDVNRSGFAMATDPRVMAIVAVSTTPNRIGAEVSALSFTGGVDSLEYIVFLAAEAGSQFLDYT
tara:strand:- start:1389 stop:1628 length:240 start_codon:yes stop_codon:yes gene_type:complete